MQKILFCNIGWMNNYEGLNVNGDKIVNGGKWVNKHGSGGEVCNFLPCRNGLVYGHVESWSKVRKNGRKKIIDTKIDLSNLGATDIDQTKIDGVTVVWVATSPLANIGRCVVGWYKNATVYRERQEFSSYPSAQHKKDEIYSYRIVTKSDNVVLLNAAQRDLFRVRDYINDKKGFLGQKAWCFAKHNMKPPVKEFVNLVIKAINSKEAVKTPRKKSSTGKENGNKGTSSEYRSKIENCAIKAVESFYTSLLSSCFFKDVGEKDLGWDIEIFQSGKEFLRVEVKGRSTDTTSILLTPNEYKVFDQESKKTYSNYRLCIVNDINNKKQNLFIINCCGKKYDTDHYQINSKKQWIWIKKIQLGQHNFRKYTAARVCFD